MTVLVQVRQNIVIKQHLQLPFQKKNWYYFVLPENLWYSSLGGYWFRDPILLPNMFLPSYRQDTVKDYLSAERWQKLLESVSIETTLLQTVVCWDQAPVGRRYLCVEWWGGCPPCLWKEWWRSIVCWWLLITRMYTL